MAADDTNVAASAAIRAGKPHGFLLEAMLGGKCAPVTSNETVNETREVLSRPKFRLDEHEIGGVASVLDLPSNVIKTKSKFSVAGDPDDDVFANAAHDGRADYIMSGDRALLDLG